MDDSIENLLYSSPPTGWPLEGVYIGVEFEVGGAYEDWGWVARDSDGKTICSNRYLQDFLKEIRRLKGENK